MSSQPVQDETERDRLIEEKSQEFPDPEWDAVDRWVGRDPDGITGDYWGGRGPEWEAHLAEHEQAREAEPPENDPEWDPWSYDSRTTAEIARDNAAGDAITVRHQAEAGDAEQFAKYYGEPPTPAAEREPGE